MRFYTQNALVIKAYEDVRMSEWGGITVAVLHRVIDQYFCALESVLGYKSLYLTILYFYCETLLKAEYGCRLEFNKCVINV